MRASMDVFKSYRSIYNWFLCSDIEDATRKFFLGKGAITRQIKDD
jgi:hypothetical protein